MRFALMIAGYKGVRFLENIDKIPKFVVSYDNQEGNSDSLQKIEEICKDKKIRFFKQKSLIDIEELANSVDKIFLIGWQFLVRTNYEKLIVFHDSYLPERRGFSPTVDALINKSKYLGASAFTPFEGSTEPDYGDVYFRMKKDISYPISLEDSFNIVVDMYVGIFNKILNKNLKPKKIDYSGSTFSVWRDKEDMMIDWKDTSDNIYNKTLILGYPYDGACAVYESQEIRIKESEIVPDIEITNRSENVGKIWKIDSGCPVVICGSGLLKINKAIKNNGDVIQFNNLRRRFK